MANPNGPIKHEDAIIYDPLVMSGANAFFSNSNKANQLDGSLKDMHDFGAALACNALLGLQGGSIKESSLLEANVLAEILLQVTDDTGSIDIKYLQAILGDKDAGTDPALRLEAGVRLIILAQTVSSLFAKHDISFSMSQLNTELDDYNGPAIETKYDNLVFATTCEVVISSGSSIAKAQDYLGIEGVEEIVILNQTPSRKPQEFLIKPRAKPFILSITFKARPDGLSKGYTVVIEGATSGGNKANFQILTDGKELTDVANKYNTADFLGLLSDSLRIYGQI